MKSKKDIESQIHIDALNEIVGDGDMALPQKVNELIEKYQTLEQDYAKKSELQLTALHIGNAINDGIYIINLDGIIIDANQSYTNLTGLHRSEIIGQHADRIAHLYFDVNEAVSILSLKGLGKRSQMTRAIKTKKELLVTSTPLFDDSGKLINVLTVIRDVTEINVLRDQLSTNQEMNVRYKEEVAFLRQNQIGDTTMIGQSPSIESLREQIEQIGKVDATVIITGETGVGKEVVAREIHKVSTRNEGPYIKVNCAAIPENLIESELFGYEKGAFTGASGKSKIGMFEMADGGTILLDEIGELPLLIQSKLLRVLQEKEFFKVGGTTSIKVDVRVIAATNRDLKIEVQEGRFRDDLYYRLHVIPLTVAPLRERGEDIRLLSEYFLEKYNRKYGVRHYFGRNTMNVFNAYEWPGNVRELENVIERLAVVARGDEILSSDAMGVIGSYMTADVQQKDHLPLKSAVAALEKQMIEEALGETGSTYKAAKKLGINQSTVVRKAKQYGIEDW
jgi:PAS domain S-box-containing protein